MLFLLLLAACATPPRSSYVPGGEGLPLDARYEYRRVLFLEYSGEPAAALEKVVDLSTQYPTRLAFHLRRIRLTKRVYGAERAARLYDPPPPGVGRRRAEILARLASTEESAMTDRIDILRFAIEQEPKEPHWHLALADVEIAAHDEMAAQAESERELGAVAAAEVSAARAAELLASVLSRAEHVLSLDPLFAEAHVLVGYICTRQADAAKTIDERLDWRRQAGERYNRAIELDPDSLPALLNRAENAIFFDDHSAAETDLLDAARVAPGVALVWSNLGSIYYQIGRLQDAQDAYGKALAIEPAEARTRAAYADCLRRRGNARQAVVELERARKNTTDPRLLSEIAFKLGTIHEHERRYRKAVEEYEWHIHYGEKVGVDGSKARSRIQHMIDHAFEDER